MKLHNTETKKQLTVADLKDGEIGQWGKWFYARPYSDGSVSSIGFSGDNELVYHRHGADRGIIDSLYPTGSKLVIDFANSKIEVILPPAEEPKPQLTTGDLKPGQIGETYGGNFVMCFADGKRYFLGTAALPNDNALTCLVRILPPGTLLEVE